MSGGTVKYYMNVLELYCRDAAKRIEFLSSAPDEESLTLFITQVHALKSASASIGASALSKKAEALEDAGHRGDIAAISEGLDGFREDLSLTVERIGRALSLQESVPDDGAAAVLDKTALLRLKKALEAEDVGEADGVLNQLREMSFGQEIADIVSGIKDCVLLSDFTTAAEMTDKLMEEAGR
jgi:HPt (histidine-containing phosphotransfer) domain-containing protein